MNWRSIRIGDFLHRIRIPVDIEDDQEYNLVTIRMHHMGVALRGTKRGNDIGTKRMYRVAPGHFILSGIDARHGAFGIVPEELDGAVVTNDFWYFEVDEKQVDKELFLHLTSTSFFDDLCRIASDGTTNRVRLQADKFFNYKISLPAVEDQRELMAQLKHTNAAVATVLDETDQQLTHLTQLRQALLREAMQGQLLPQDPTDEPAVELLKKLQAAKAATGKAKKGKAGALFAEEAEAVEGPFEIPASWVWCKMENLYSQLLGGLAFESSKYTKSESNNQVLRLGNVKNDCLLLDAAPVFIDEEYATAADSARLKPNDILITMTGTRAKKDYLFSLKLAEEDFINKSLFLNQRVGCFRFPASISAGFINLGLTQKEATLGQTSGLCSLKPATSNTCSVRPKTIRALIWPTICPASAMTR